MKKIIVLLFTCLLCSFCPLVSADDFDVAAKNAIAFDVNTGKILYEKEATTPVPIGSLTKLLSAYLVYDAIKAEKITMDSQVEISEYALNLTTNYDISNLPLDKGSYSVEELLEASLIANANSATIALAEKIAGSEKKFVDLMKDKLKEWGISDAKIVNSTGLNNSHLGDNIYPNSKKDEENQLSAYDMALISYHLIKDYPQVLNITEKTSFNFEGLEVNSSNYMLKDMPSYRKGVDGLKTGISNQGGLSFIASANERDMSHISVINGSEDQIKAIASKNLNIIQRIGSDLEPKVTFKKNKQEFKAPLTAHTPIGTLSYKDTDLIGKGYLKEEPSITMETEKEVTQGFFLKVWWNNFVEYVNEKL